MDNIRLVLQLISELKWTAIAQVISSVGVVVSIFIGIRNWNDQNRRDEPQIVPVPIGFQVNENANFTHKLAIEFRNIGIAPAFDLVSVTFALDNPLPNDDEPHPIIEASEQYFSQKLFTGIPAYLNINYSLAANSPKKFFATFFKYRKSPKGEWTLDHVFMEFEGVSTDNKIGRVHYIARKDEAIITKRLSLVEQKFLQKD